MQRSWEPQGIGSDALGFDNSFSKELS